MIVEEFVLVETTSRIYLVRKEMYNEDSLTDERLLAYDASLILGKPIRPSNLEIRFKRGLWQTIKDKLFGTEILPEDNLQFEKYSELRK